MKKHYDTIIYKGEELIWNGLVWENESYIVDEYILSKLIDEGSEDIVFINNLS